MNYNNLGNTEISISEIGLGCWTLGGLNWEQGRVANGWAPVDQKAAIRTAPRDLNLG